ncbi:MAG: hypothetical protein AAF281_08580, partial [Pseudomonadota bacterium]
MTGALRPPLRTDLALRPGPVAWNGAPSWILHDPPSHRFHRLGWLQVEVLRRWDRPLTDERLAEDIARTTTLTPKAQDIGGFQQFLAQNHLLDTPAPERTKAFVQAVAAKRDRPLFRVVKSYFFTRIPLVRPDRFLTALHGVVQPMAKPMLAVLP